MSLLYSLSPAQTQTLILSTGQRSFNTQDQFLHTNIVTLLVLYEQKLISMLQCEIQSHYANLRRCKYF